MTSLLRMSLAEVITDAPDCHLKVAVIDLMASDTKVCFNTVTRMLIKIMTPEILHRLPDRYIPNCIICCIVGSMVKTRKDAKKLLSNVNPNKIYAIEGAMTI